MEYQVFLKSLCLLHCVPLYVCRLCINFQDLCASLLGDTSLRILHLTFILRFVVDFLSIRKVIIFSAIATDDCHPLRSRSMLASYPGPYTRAVHSSFQGGIRAWYPLFCTCADLKPLNILKLRW